MPSADDYTRAAETAQSFKAEDVLGRFFNIFLEKSSFTRGVPSAPGNPNFAEEKKLLHSHVSNLYWGIGCTVISFLSFRVSKYTGPISWKSLGRRLKYSHANEQTQPSIIPDHRPTVVGPPSSKLDQYISTLSDIVVSALLGCSITLFLIDKEKLKKDLVRIPLLDGKSHIAEELCPDFMAEYERIPSTFWDQNEMKSGNYTDLMHIRDFVLNCRIRQERLASSHAVTREDIMK